MSSESKAAKGGGQASMSSSKALHPSKGRRGGARNATRVAKSADDSGGSKRRPRNSHQATSLSSGDPGKDSSVNDSSDRRKRPSQASSGNNSRGKKDGVGENVSTDIEKENERESGEKATESTAFLDELVVVMKGALQIVLGKEEVKLETTEMMCDFVSFPPSPMYDCIIGGEDTHTATAPLLEKVGRLYRKIVGRI